MNNFPTNLKSGHTISNSQPAGSTPTHPTGDREEVTVNLANPAHGGSVIGRVDGQVVFVTGGLPGESDVRVALDPASASKSKRSFRTGSAVSVGQPSLHRIEGQCPAAAAGAGCCDLDFVDAEGSIDFKREVVTDQLRRIGRIELSEDRVDTHVLQPTQGWRTRVRLGVNENGRAGLRKKNSHEIVEISVATCAQWAPGLVEGLSEHEFTPNAEVAVALGDDGTRSVVELTGSRNQPHREVVLGDPTIVHQVGDVAWSLPADAFWQGHRAAPEFYSSWIQKHVPAGEGVAWDLYGGAGVFAVALADRVDAVDSVDVGSESTDAGKAAMTLANIDNVRFVSGDVARQLDALRSHEGLHAVVLDPPRTGAGKNVVRRIAQSRPQHVVHVGCDPATAARDLAEWVANGYQIDALTVVDAFPLTHHVEMLVALSRV